MRLTATLLLVLLLLNSFFYCLYYNACRWQREGEVKAGIEQMQYSNKVTLIKIPAATATGPLASDDEITWNGMLVDVIKRQVMHDTVYIYALPDEQEQALVDKINDYVSGGLGTGLKDGYTLHPVLHLVKLLPQLYLGPDGGQILAKTVTLAPCQYACGYRCYAYADIPAPPPKQYQANTIRCMC